MTFRRVLFFLQFARIVKRHTRKTAFSHFGASQTVTPTSFPRNVHSFNIRHDENRYNRNTRMNEAVGYAQYHRNYYSFMIRV